MQATDHLEGMSSAPIQADGSVDSLDSPQMRFNSSTGNRTHSSSSFTGIHSICQYNTLCSCVQTRSQHRAHTVSSDRFCFLFFLVFLLSHHNTIIHHLH